MRRLPGDKPAHPGVACRLAGPCGRPCCSEQQMGSWTGHKHAPTRWRTASRGRLSVGPGAAGPLTPFQPPFYCWGHHWTVYGGRARGMRGSGPGHAGVGPTHAGVGPTHAGPQRARGSRGRARVSRGRARVMRGSGPGHAGVGPGSAGVGPGAYGCRARVSRGRARVNRGRGHPTPPAARHSAGRARQGRLSARHGGRSCPSLAARVCRRR